MPESRRGASTGVERLTWGDALPGLGRALSPRERTLIETAFRAPAQVSVSVRRFSAESQSRALERHMTALYVLAQERANAELRAAHARAETEALEILFAHLSARQRDSYVRLGYFHVVASTGRRWRILVNSATGNCCLLDHQETVVARYCAHGREPSLPLSAHHLIQKIALEADEPAFLSAANPY